MNLLSFNRVLGPQVKVNIFRFFVEISFFRLKLIFQQKSIFLAKPICPSKGIANIFLFFFFFIIFFFGCKKTKKRETKVNILRVRVNFDEKTKSKKNSSKISVFARI